MARKIGSSRYYHPLSQPLKFVVFLRDIKEISIFVKMLYAINRKVDIDVNGFSHVDSDIL